MHDPFIEILERILFGDDGKVVSSLLRFQNGSCGDIASISDGYPHDDTSRFNDTLASHRCPKQQALHPDKGVIVHQGRAMDLNLMSQRHPMLRRRRNEFYGQMGYRTYLRQLQ